MTAAVIAIDGPSGSGKGEISHRVASRLGWVLLDSGALYRLVALESMRRGIAEDDPQSLADVARRLDVAFERGANGGRIVRLCGNDVSAAIRTEACGEIASRIAPLEPVRAALLTLQRDMRRPPGLVADGRDMGTVVFPDAELKVVLTASPEERARRRYKQLKEKGIDVSLPALSADLAERDRRDSERRIAPLRPAPDARILDTTHLDIEETVDAVMAMAARLSGSAQ